MATTYIETKVPSYYTPRNAWSILQASRQLATRKWWDQGCTGFNLITSTEPLNEVREGNPNMAAEKLELLRGIRVLPVTQNVVELARVLIASGLVPSIASPDAVPLAIASVYEVDVELLNAYRAATVEQLVAENNIEPPEWYSNIGRSLRAPWFASDRSTLRAVQIHESPPAFRSRNIFVSENIWARR